MTGKQIIVVYGIPINVTKHWTCSPSLHIQSAHVEACKSKHLDTNEKVEGRQACQQTYAAIQAYSWVPE